LIIVGREEKEKISALASRQAGKQQQAESSDGKARKNQYLVSSFLLPTLLLLLLLPLMVTAFALLALPAPILHPATLSVTTCNLYSAERTALALLIIVLLFRWNN